MVPVMATTNMDHGPPTTPVYIQLNQTINRVIDEMVDIKQVNNVQ